MKVQRQVYNPLPHSPRHNQALWCLWTLGTKLTKDWTEVRSCVKVEAAVLGTSSVTDVMVSVDTKQRRTEVKDWSTLKHIIVSTLQPLPDRSVEAGKSTTSNTNNHSASHSTDSNFHPSPEPQATAADTLDTFVSTAS